METRDNCLIWPDILAYRELVSHSSTKFWKVDSARAGGRYSVDVLSESKMLETLDEGVRARLTTLLVDL